jgi:hypothetical protein
MQTVQTWINPVVAQHIHNDQTTLALILIDNRREPVIIWAPMLSILTICNFFVITFILCKHYSYLFL